MIIPIVHNPNNKFTVATLHYSLDPFKNTPEWKEKAKQGLSDNAFRREYEIDYTFFAGKPFFPEFNQYNISPQPFIYKDKRVIYRGWDYGFHHPCCVVSFLNEFEQWCLLKAIIGVDEGIRDFATRVRTYCLSTYLGAKYIDADDIAGIQVSDKSQMTSRQILNALGIYPQGRKQEIQQGVNIIRQKLKLRVDGKPGLLVDPTQTDIIDGFKGGIHYPDKKEGQHQDETYEKEGFFEHIFDGIRYLATEMFTIIGQTQQTNEISYDPLQMAWRDGRPRQTLDPNEIVEQDDLSNLMGGNMGDELLG